VAKTVDLEKHQDQPMSKRVQVIILTAKKMLMILQMRKMLKEKYQVMKGVQTNILIVEVRRQLKIKMIWLTTYLKDKSL
jgi:uncharacterized FAD-dependent dehydrogenase